MIFLSRMCARVGIGLKPALVINRVSKLEQTFLCESETVASGPTVPARIKDCLPKHETRHKGADKRAQDIRAQRCQSDICADYIIIFRSTKILAPIADLRLCTLCPCAFMSWRPYVPATYVCVLMSCALML